MRAHGQFEIHREGDVIISRLIGAWNAEALQAFHGDETIVRRWLDQQGFATD